MGVKLRSMRFSRVFDSMERIRLEHEGASHWARTSSDSPRRTASQPPWTETRRTKEATARSRARGRSYGFSESRSATSNEAATEEAAERSAVAASAGHTEAT